MRVIFLDIDGVLNSEAHLLKLEARHEALGHEALSTSERETTCTCFKHHAQVDRAAVACLNRLVAATDAKIVISSTWRKLFDLPELQRILVEHGLVGEIIGETPDGHHVPELLELYSHPERLCRGYEIDFWLRQHPEVDRFVILDDGADMVMHVDRLVQTDCADGLGDEHVEIALRVMAWDGRSETHPARELPARRALTAADLAAVAAFVDQVVARGLMASSSVEIQAIRRLVREHPAHGVREVLDDREDLSRDLPEGSTP